MSVAKAVLRIRQEKGLTQKEVGRRAGLATSYVSRIENGRIQPTMVTLTRVAEALEVLPAELLQSAEEPRPESVQRCPVSNSGACVGELIRSHKGRAPKAGDSTYGPIEIRILRMADYVATHGSRTTRSALTVLLESLVHQVGMGSNGDGRRSLKR